jgi:hypothetical protein
MIAVMKATESVIIGYGMFNFIPPITGRKGPEFKTRSHNPREATVKSIKELSDLMLAQMGGLVRDRMEWAITMGVERAWIKNLDEVMNFKGPGRPPVIEWTEAGLKGVADMFNGNHRYQILLDLLATQLEQREEVVKRMEAFEVADKPSKLRKMQHEKDKEILADLEKILDFEGQFIVKLADLGEFT